MAAFLFVTLTVVVLSQRAALGAERVKHKRFYIHDYLNLQNPVNGTAVAVASSSSYTGFLPFGTVLVFDDKVTAAPDYNSSALGRAQGISVSDALPDPANPFNVSFFITATVNLPDGRISLHGQDAILEPVRDIAIVGGTGEYSFTSGIARLRTYSATGTFSIVQVDIYYTKLFNIDVDKL